MSNGRRGMTLNTPEFYWQQINAAAKRIGPHILVAALYRGGVVVGHRYNRRQNKQRQWLEKIDENKIMAGYGDFGDLQELRGAMRSAKQFLKYWITDRYITNDYLSNGNEGLRQIIKDQCAESRPYVANLLFIDTASEEILYLDYSGVSKPLTGFGVLGGTLYFNEKEMFAEQDQLLKDKGLMGARTLPPDVLIQYYEIEKKHTRDPLKGAIKDLEEFFGDKTALNTKEETAEVVKEVLQNNDPPSKTEEFEITVFENGEFASSYFKREKSNAPTAPPAPQAVPGKERNPDLGIEVKFEDTNDNGGDDEDNEP